MLRIFVATLACVLTLAACTRASKEALPTNLETPTPDANATTDLAPRNTELSTELRLEFGRIVRQVCACTDYECALLVGRGVAPKLVSLVKKYPNSWDDELEGYVLEKRALYAACFNRVAPKDRQLKPLRVGETHETKKLDAFAAKMCACTTPKCADHVYVALRRWLKKEFKDGGRHASWQAVNTWKKATRKLAVCYARITKKPKDGS